MSPDAFADPLTHHIAELDDVFLRYVLGGAGESVVLLHGVP